MYAFRHLHACSVAKIASEQPELQRRRLHSSLDEFVMFGRLAASAHRLRLYVPHPHAFIIQNRNVRFQIPPVIMHLTDDLAELVVDGQQKQAFDG
jgi:hypothetical protein